MVKLRVAGCSANGSPSWPVGVSKGANGALIAVTASATGRQRNALSSEGICHTRADEQTLQLLLGGDPNAVDLIRHFAVQTAHRLLR